jgi:hypothetical protein
MEKITTQNTLKDTPYREVWSGMLPSREYIFRRFFWPEGEGGET